MHCPPWTSEQGPGVPLPNLSHCLWPHGKALEHRGGVTQPSPLDSPTRGKAMDLPSQTSENIRYRVPHLDALKGEDFLRG